MTIRFPQHTSSQIYILFIIMTDESVQIASEPKILENSDGEVLIPIATNILIDLSPASPVSPEILLCRTYL